jgi:hypothetical protein
VVARSALFLLLGCCGCAPVSRGLTVPNNLWSVTVLGDSTDARFAATVQAVAHWNALLDTIGARIRLAPPVTSPQRVSESAIRGLSSSVRSRRVTRPAELDSIAGDLVIALTDLDIISYGYSPQRLGRGFIALRSALLPPLRLPNVARNVVAHEIGHVLGLPHNDLPGMLMCSGPEACRPIAFRSDTAVFFPLTVFERRLIADRWR